MIPNEVKQETFDIDKHKVLEQEPLSNVGEGGHFVNPLPQIADWRTPEEIHDDCIKAINPIIMPEEIEVFVTSDPHALGMPKEYPRLDKFWYKMERVFSEEIAAQVDTIGPKLTISKGCGRWDKRIIDAVLYHEAGHCFLKHSEIYNHNVAWDCHKAEFEADDFAYDEVNKRTGIVEVTDMGMLLRNYHQPTWECWAKSHPSTYARYQRQAARWDLPTVEELEKTL
jgi:hypothetical protein